MPVPHKSCLKCGHEADVADAPHAACPACGAIYAKVEEAVRSGRVVRRGGGGAESAFSESAFAASRPAPARAGAARREAGRSDTQTFVQRMRAQSLYPTWRQLVGFLAVVGYGVAALILLGGVVGVWQGGVLGIPILLGSVVVALFVVLITRVSREGWLMLADLSDAAVRLAAQTEEK